MKIVVTSDTHNYHSELKLPAADVFIHCGDFSQNGTLKEAKEFLEWMDGIDAQYKIFIAGNHDLCFANERRAAHKLIPPNCTYLEDSFVNYEGYTFYGTPYTQKWFDKGFAKHRDTIGQYWSKIPNSIDVLITHTPPLGILDQNKKGEACGCKDLKEHVTMRVKPKVHVFGHIHESFGYVRQDGTTFINVAYMRRQDVVENRFWVLNLPNK